MKPNRRGLRRLIMGMSVEDSNSKFDTPEARRALLIAHQRHNQGVYHELQYAQRQRDKMTPEKKCHICRFAKPSVKGFQAYTKGDPDDYVVRELWDDSAVVSSGVKNEAGQPATVTPHTDTLTTIGDKVSKERETIKAKRKIVLDTLAAALKEMKEQIAVELLERAESGTVATGQQQKPIVDRLIAEVNEGKEKGYRSVSSSSHLLIPVEMTARLYAKKDQEVADAFKEPLLAFPAREGDISFSLWVAGGLIADTDLIKAYPYQIARYVAGEDEASASRLPRASVEVYFSPELYQMQRAIGPSGIASIRQFIGRIMQRQHEPTPVSTSELLNASKEERELFHTLKGEAIQIPWVQKTKMKISTKTGVVFSEEDSEESATSVAKKEALAHVWKTWGHLIKDLHVHGDLDFLYVSINRRQEVRDNDDYITEVRQVETEKETSKAVATSSTTRSASSLRTTRNMFALAAKSDRRKNIYVPMAADFTVVECSLERCGLPHNMVVEDITNALQEMQTQTLEMLRLSVVDELEELKDVDTSEAVPVLYAPKIVVSHAGVIENGTHSYQRIRIRGSTLAHVETLVEALKETDYFTDRSGPIVEPEAALTLSLPPNLTFKATHSRAASMMRRSSRRLLGHNVGAPGERDESGLLKPYQECQEFDFLSVSEDERQFWKDHYYRLSDATLVFHDRVDPNDVFSKDATANTRLMEQVALVQSAVHSDQDANGDDVTAATPVKTGKGRRASKRTKQGKRVPDSHPSGNSNLAPDAMFQLMCMDMESEAARFDLAPGDCRGYAYDIRLRKVTSQAAPLVRPAVLSLETKGFINYFGSSRFATYTKMNMHPGLHLLKGEFRAAAYIIVQQFYLDAAVAAERKHTGSAFPSILNLKGVHLPDFTKSHNRRSVAEHGTALQKVLNNAIQASMLFREDGEDSDIGGVSAIDVGTSPQSSLTLSDPCAEAFLKVIGPRACSMLIQEFLSFVWNDICNQRLQRYGTFSILPGDLVYSTPTSSSPPLSQITRVTRRDVEQQRYTPHDVLLPLPGAGIELPDNHTTDLYVVALKRLGIVFDPEQKQWNLFYPTTLPQDATETSELRAPYRMLTPTFALMEEELSSATPTADPLGNDQWRNGGGAPPGPGVGVNHIRQDLRRQGGNLLGLYVSGGYRHPLFRPELKSWALRRGVIGDPYQRWGVALLDSREPLDGRDNSVEAMAPSPTGRPEGHARHPVPQFLKPNPIQVRRRERAAATVAAVTERDGDGGGDLGDGRAAEMRRGVSTRLPAPAGAVRRRPFYHSGVSRVGRTLPHPATPYWLPQSNDSCLELSVELPPSVYPHSMLRELVKSDVFTPDVVDIDRPLIDSRPRSFEALTSDQQAKYRRLLAKRRKQAFQTPPRAISLALLHQQIFRSGGARFSLIPTLRSYDSVSTK